MQGSSIKSTFRDYIRIIFQRKKYILVPAIGITACFAIYAFFVADEVYTTSNYIVVLDSKTNKPIIENLTTTSDLGKRVARSVSHVMSRSGTFDIIASIDYLASNFPNSEDIQNRRLKVLQEKQTILQFRMAEISKKLRNLSDRLTEEEDPYERLNITSHTRQLISTRSVLDSQCGVLEEKIRAADATVKRIALIEEKFAILAASYKTDPSNETLRAEYEGQKSQRDAAERRLASYIRDFQSSLALKIVGNSVTASFESTDPQLCKDVVDETLFRVELENIYLKRQEILTTEEILDEKIKEYEQRVAEKEMELKQYQRLHLLNISPGVINSEVFYDELVKAGTIIPAGTPPSAVLARVKALYEQKTETEQNLDKLRAERDDLALQLEQAPEFVENTVLQDQPERIDAIREKMGNLEIERAKMLETMTEKHPHVAAIDKHIQNLQEMLRNSSKLETSHVERVRNPLHEDLQSRLSRVRAELSGEQRRHDSIVNMFDYYYEEAKQVPEIVIKHSKLLGELHEDSTMLKNLRNRQKGASITKALEVESQRGTRFEKRDPTLVPLTPYKPNRRILMLLGLILGMAGAAVTLFFVEYADRSIRGINDVKRHLGLPLLGTIPFFFKRNGAAHVREGLTPRAALVSLATVTVAVALVAAFAFDGEVSGFVNAAVGRTPHSDSRLPHEVFPGESRTAFDPSPQESRDIKLTNIPSEKPPALEIVPGVFAADEDTDTRSNTGSKNNNDGSNAQRQP